MTVACRVFRRKVPASGPARLWMRCRRRCLCRLRWPEVGAVGGSCRGGPAAASASGRCGLQAIPVVPGSPSAGTNFTGGFRSRVTSLALMSRGTLAAEDHVIAVRSGRPCKALCIEFAVLMGRT
jgi:hypothetical protein